MHIFERIQNSEEEFYKIHGLSEFATFVYTRGLINCLSKKIKKFILSEHKQVSKIEKMPQRNKLPKSGTKIGHDSIPINYFNVKIVIYFI